jgi:hypothetical protein
VPEQKIICVVGMHRSGTSLATRLLNLLGVYLGPEEHLMPPALGNPEGYWEHQLLTDLDDEVLARLGGSWDAPPAVSPETFAGAGLADLRRRARVLVAQEFGDAPMWGWKDPRTCLGLPFWQRVVQPTGYVLCLRDPLDAARSLARSNGLDCGLELWLRYTHDALAYTLGRPRLLVFYEDVLRDWPGELRRLAAFVGLNDRIDRVARIVKGNEVVRPDLAHHRNDLADAVDDPRLSFPAKALYLALRLARELPARSAKRLPHATLETFAAAAYEVGPVSLVEEAPRAIVKGDGGELGAGIAELRQAVVGSLERGREAGSGR